MANTVCAKIQKIITQEVTSEAHLAYLFTGMEKIIEQDGVPDHFTFIKFYIDWALHSKLSDDEEKEVLKLLNDLDFTDTDLELPTKLEEFSRFRNLFKEIKEFLTCYNIHFSQQMEYDYAAKFMQLYTQIIESSPLVLDIPTDEKSKIKKVTVKIKLEKQIKPGQQYYKTSWIIEDTNDQKHELYIANSFNL